MQDERSRITRTSRSRTWPRRSRRKSKATKDLQSFVAFDLFESSWLIWQNYNLRPTSYDL